MFVITMPPTFKIGDTADACINGEQKRLTWRDTDTLVIEPDDVRTIEAVKSSLDGSQMFICSDADVSA